MVIELDITPAWHFFDEVNEYSKNPIQPVHRAEQSADKPMGSAADFEVNLDFAGYNSADDAFKGHYDFCNKWAKRDK